MMIFPDVGDIILMTKPNEYHLITKRVNEYMFEMLCLNYGYTRNMATEVLKRYPWVKVA
jgi:hypothetical protein